jgi:hypothetical protein
VSRWISAAALVLLLLCMARWSQLNLDGAIGWRDLVYHPERRDGEQVVLSLVSVGPALSPERYLVLYGSLPIPVVGPASEVTRGEDISVGGTFSAAEGAVIADWVEHRPARTGKKTLGLLAIAVLAVLVPACWRLGPDGLVLRG